MQRHEPIMDRECGSKIAGKGRFLELRAQPRRDIGRHRNASYPAMGVEGERGSILARQLDEL
jgi:hypothetical protein